ncbi:hypothetical protein SynPROSU1_01745 [Synechococcus sp. PROS-U-1]|nr:hypothetical protein SynPROSU1_01745 [Synechococcus sp. PROS-U-1]
MGLLEFSRGVVLLNPFGDTQQDSVRHVLRLNLVELDQANTTSIVRAHP